MWRFFFSAFLLIWTAPPAKAEETLPIWLNEGVFGIARIEDYERRLNQLFPADADISLPARYGRPQRWVRNCGDYLERHFEESLTRWELVSPRYHAFAVVEPCELLKYLKWARPAARSFLRGGLFEGPLHDLLPADFGVSESCQQPIYDLGRDREMPIPSWRESVAEYGHEFEIEFVGDDQAKVSEDHYVLHVMDALARADFNGDGFEDVLLLLVTLQAPGRGTGERFWRRYGHWQEVAILTRAAPGGRFRTLHSQTIESCFHFNLKKYGPPAGMRADDLRPPFRLQDLGPPVR
jgi:hypothetical protein